MNTKWTGLYNPELEHDSCGVGFVVNIKGKKSHQIIEQGLQILVNLEHRGACGCDPDTGDGAGIQIQIPDKLFRKEFGDKLPAEGEYAVGMVFLPKAKSECSICQAIIEKTVADEGQEFIGWRDVPVDNTQIGWKSREVEPEIKQFIVKRAGNLGSDDMAFERKLFVIRKVIEKTVYSKYLKETSYFYICSLSSRTIVYKGLLLARQIAPFYLDLCNSDVQSCMALVHQRFSTNTYPTWDLAHPYRMIAHNGEINALRGNRNWMRAREARLTSKILGSDVEKIKPLVNLTGSDSATFDNALELLVMGGRSLVHSLMMLIPEAWGHYHSMDPDLEAFYEFNDCIMEPWDGPAAIAFTDGRQIGAILDRNGLRPARYLVTKNDLVMMASETGALDIPPEDIIEKGRLRPARLFLVDTVQGKIISNRQAKLEVAQSKPYREWLEKYRIELSALPEPQSIYQPNHETIIERQKVFGYTLEDLNILLKPMAIRGEEPIGSMGDDTPLAVLSQRPRLLYDYFRQLFAQVTNPAIDPLREELIMSSMHYIGSNGSLLDESSTDCQQVRLHSVIISNSELEKLRNLSVHGLKTKTLSTLFDPASGSAGLETELRRLTHEASQALADGFSAIILTDRGVSENLAPIPALLATSTVHNHLINEGNRTNVALVVESGEPREVMHFALLVGYGASAVNPYLAFETIADMMRNHWIEEDISVQKAYNNFIKACSKGILKIMSKMGISTVQSYKGAQVFESIGLDNSVIEKYFIGTPSRIGGVKIETIADEVISRHDFAFKKSGVADNLELDPGGKYQWRMGGEFHQINPDTIQLLQRSARTNDYLLFKQFSNTVNQQSEALATLRGLFRFKKVEPIPISEVEPASEIVKRFCTGAMSLGSLSRETHETLAIAMNRIGGKSNTGEGGEDPERFVPGPNGVNRRSAIKQVASARFGVTIHYLVNADELQIKISQGAKPGEGGQLPGHKVDEYIARLRYATPGVTLISPPPHHDIYSIEDLSQLIFDLKNANPKARISVKLVSEVGVGTIASGVAKAHADLVLISGAEGGTGASPLSSIKHAGVPWELGLAETQQALVKNDLRRRIRVQTDGQLKTGRDVVIAGLLGAEEFGFSTAPLVTLGCIMMRVCHQNTCPAGVATQDPELRKRFSGKPEYVVNFFYFVAQEVREIMAQLGCAKFDDLVGRVDLLETKKAVDHWKAKGVDVSPLLYNMDPSGETPIRKIEDQDHGLDTALDNQLIELCKDALDNQSKVELTIPIRNVNRTVGTMLSGEIARKYGVNGLPADTIQIHFTGNAGQSFGAFLSKGVTFVLEGDSNDYLGKGLSGGKLIIYPDAKSTFEAHKNVVAGNVCLYGATGGHAFIRGMVGERFAVRNSGAVAVVEGTGDHCCEYMTGGIVISLGKTGRNFGAGMSGGCAYVWDFDEKFNIRVNKGGSLLLERIVDDNEKALLKDYIKQHKELTGSTRAEEALSNWDEVVGKFYKVISVEYKELLQKRNAQELTEAKNG